MKKFVCTICGYVHEGDSAPDMCPICKAKAEKFAEQAGEKLAELIGVSTAAVSKWECGNSYPDITLLPKLAEIFDVSMDYLFDYRRAEEKTIPETVAEASRLGKEGKREEAIALLRQTLERYPQNETLTFVLARHIFLAMVRFNSLAKRKAGLGEAEKLFLMVAERTADTSRRAWCYQFLTSICLATCDYERAEQYNNHLLTGRGMYPKVTAAMITLRLKSPEETECAMLSTMGESLYEYLYMGSWYVAFLLEHGRYEDVAAVGDRALQIVRAGIDAGQAYLYKEGSEFAESKALAYAHMERYGDCLEALETACEYACAYDALDNDRTYDVYDMTGEMHHIEERISARADMLGTLQCGERESDYGPIQSDPRYQAILARLQTT